MNPHAITKHFEQALCEYTGAPFAVVVNSCTMALLLAVAWHMREIMGGPHSKPWCRDDQDFYPEISIPKRTYVSVPQAIAHAGGRPTFREEDWRGIYQLKPLPVWDSARWFTKDMYVGAPRRLQGDVLLYGSQLDHVQSFGGQFVCLSFHQTKTLGDTQGGAILHDNAEADAWLRRARFDGRTEGVAPKDDRFDMIGHHCYISPDVSARLLARLYCMRHTINMPMPNDDYPDLSTFEIFK